MKSPIYKFLIMKACGSLYADSNVKIIGGEVAIEG